jgi:hypothetical protein
MNPTSTRWRIAGAVFVLVNVAGAGYALAMGEPMHALTHVAIVVGGYVIWRLGPWRSRTRAEAVPAQLSDERLNYLQQSVDAVALEVERIGEAQRYADKLRVERGETPSTKKEE